MKRLYGLFYSLIMMVMLTSIPAVAVTYLVGPENASENVTEDFPYRSNYGGQRTQFIIYAEELHMHGLAAGTEIRSIALLHIEGTTLPLNMFRIRMSHTNLNQFETTSFIQEMQVVYGGSQTQYISGVVDGPPEWKTIELESPFRWDGSSNIVVEYAWSNDNWGSGNQRWQHIETFETRDENFNDIFRTLEDPEDNVANYNEFQNDGQRRALVPKLQLGVTPVYGTSISCKPIETDFGYIERNATSEAKSIDIKVYGSPNVTSATISPQANAYVALSQDADTWVTTPNTLSVNNMQNGVARKIWVKMKAQEEGFNHSTSLKISVTGAEREVYLKATSNRVHKYCESAANSDNYSEIGCVTILKDGEVVMKNGEQYPIYERPDARRKYSDFTETVPIPRLKIGEAYQMGVSQISPIGNLYTTRIKAYLDINQDHKLTDDEIIYNILTQSGNAVTDNSNLQEMVIIGEPVYHSDSLFFLRIVQEETSSASGAAPCGSYQWGETEDYFVKLEKGDPLYVGGVACKQISPEMTEKGTEKLPILRAEVSILGSGGSLEIRKLTFDTEGSYELSSLKKARLFFTKKDKELKDEHEIVGTAIVNPNGELEFIADTPIPMITGRHNFILTYDISDNADEETVIDARFTGLYINGSDENYVKEIFDPKGVTTIVSPAIYSMSFEGLTTTFGGSEWFSIIESNGSSKKWSTEKSVPRPPKLKAKHGDRFAFFDAYNASNNQKETLISEKISLTQSGKKQVSFWFYKHKYNIGNRGTDLEVLISNKKTIDNTAVKLSPVGNATNPLNVLLDNAPIENEENWYKYTYEIPETFNTEENYLYFRVDGDYWNNLGLDLVEINKSPLMNINFIDTLSLKKKYFFAGAKNTLIGGVNVNTYGSPKKVKLMNIGFDLTGTSNINDIENIKIWKMANNEEFDPATGVLLVTYNDIKLTNNEVSLNNETLAEGENNIYFTVDIKDNATVDNYIDIDFKKTTITREGKEEHFSREIKISNGNAEGKVQIKAGLSGEYIVGGNYNGTNYFENIYDAIDVIHDIGTVGNVQLALNADIAITQNTPIVINNFYRKDTTNTLTIYPKDKVRKIKGKYTSKVLDTEKAFFALIGVTNVTIDGRINQSDDNKHIKGLVFENGSNNNEYAHAIMLATKEPNTENQKTLRNIQINNVDLSCGGRRGNEYALYLNGKDMKNINIFNNKISNALYGIYIETPVANGWEKVVSHLQIRDNYVGNTEFDGSVGRAGINLRNADTVAIENNMVENVNTPNKMSCDGIFVGPRCAKVEVINNKVKGVYGSGNNGAYAIRVNGNTAKKNVNIKILNNVFKTVLSDMNTENDPNPAMFFVETDSLEMYHNTIVLDGDKGDIPGITTGQQTKSASIPFAMVRCSNMKIKNNAFANRVTAIGRVSGGLGMYIISNSDNIEMDRNAFDIDIKDNNANFFAFKDVMYRTLEDFKLENNDLEQNSGMTTITLDPVHPVLGTISGRTALSRNMRAPAIDGLAELRDIHGNERKNEIVTIGADEVSAEILVNNITPEITNICVPGKGEIEVIAKLGAFSDGIARDISGVEPEIVYDWQKNGQNIDNLREFMEDTNGDGTLEPVMKPVNSNIFYPEVLEDNLANPDYYTVKLYGFGKTTISEHCKVTGEEAITITKEMDEISEICTQTGTTKISPIAKGTVTGYQWQKEIGNRWVDLDGDTERELNVDLTDPKYGEGKYRVFLKDGENHCSQGGIFSRPIELKVVSPVKNAVLYSPQADADGKVEMCEGEPLRVQLMRQHIEGDIFGYRWEELVDGDWVECDPDQRDYLTDDGFSINITRPTHSGKFRLVVIGSQLCDTKEAISNVIDVTIHPYAKVIRDAQPTVVCKGKMIAISLEVEAENPRYQWQKDGVNITLEENVTANKPILVIENAKYEDAGSYQAVIDVDGCIADGTFGRLVSSPATVFVMNETQIVQEPENVTAINGKFARFEVKATAVGAPPYYTPQYQWYKGTKKLQDGNKYSGVNANILIINNVNQADAAGADYYVVIKGLCGDSLISNKVKLNLATLAFNKHLKDTEVCTGSEVTLNVNAETTVPNATITYEWHFVSNGLDKIVQNSGNTYTFTAQAANEGKYYVLAKISGVEGGVKSNTAEVKVNSTPVITKGLGVSNAKAGETFTMSVKATGRDLAYKWYRDGEVIEGATTATITRIESEPGTHSYKVEVSNMCGTVYSESSVVVEQSLADVEEANYGFTVSKIVPNPVVTDEAKFSVNAVELSKAEITITDARGRATELFSGEINGEKQFTVNTSGFVNGTYYLVININGKKITRSFVVVK